MTPEEIASLYRDGQNETVAFDVEAAPMSRMAETLAALANAHGGTVLLGVDAKSRVVKGIRSFETATEKATAAALRCEPPLVLPKPESARLEGKEILLVQVPAGLPHAYSLKGKFVTRAGKKNAALGPRQLRLLLRERGETDFESLPAPGATLDDLDVDLANRYASVFLGGTAPLRKEAVLDVLQRRNCVIKEASAWRPTVSGCLLFGREPQRVLPGAEVLLAKYPGRQLSDEFIREVVRGPLPEQINRVQGWIVSNMRKGSRIDALQREDRSEYPAQAVREAIVNAVAHRDYAIRGDEIRVLLFSDRIEVYSPGRLPGHVTVDNLVEERFSRNQVIAQVLADLGFVERLGYGIDRMIRLMREWGLPAPRFAETTNGFKVTLRGPGEKMVGDDGERSKWRRLDLNERQRSALELVVKNQHINNREYRDLFPDVSEETIRRDLADLVEEGILLKMGDKKGTYYILK